MDNFRIFKDLPHSEMIRIPTDSFTMGNDESKYDDEKPAHEVTILQPFYIGKYPVTQALWKRVMNGNNPSRFFGEERPVERVSWNDITKKFLPQLQAFTGKKFALPSEAQWEYAAKGGKNYQYAGSNDLNEVGWYGGNSFGETMPVGLKSSNDFGLHDMSGNVWEWCEDDWHRSYGEKNRPDEGTPWIDDPRALYRVLRGGSYFINAEYCSPSFRSSYAPDYRDHYIGFRLVFFS